MHLERLETRACVILGWMLAVGCGGGKQTAFLGDPSGSVTDGGDDGSNGSAPPGDDSGPAEQFTSADAAPTDTFACQPGTYTGTFETSVTSDAGGLFSFLSFDFKGTLSIVVVGEVTHGAGEVPQTTYTIAPGAELTGVDQTFGGSYAADLTGQLDCATRRFTGTVNDGVYSIVFDAGSLPMQGSLTGQYDDGDGGTPSLHGTMSLDTPQLPTVAAAGSWTASLH